MLILAVALLAIYAYACAPALSRWLRRKGYAVDDLACCERCPLRRACARLGLHRLWPPSRTVRRPPLREWLPRVGASHAAFLVLAMIGYLVGSGARPLERAMYVAYAAMLWAALALLTIRLPRPAERT